MGPIVAREQIHVAVVRGERERDTQFPRSTLKCRSLATFISDSAGHIILFPSARRHTTARHAR